MPQPTAGDVHVNKPLTNISIAYIQSADDFIADKVFPNIPVQKQSDKYFSYPKEYWFRSEADFRGPSTESAGSGYTVDSSATYFCDVLAVHKDVDDQIRANTDSPLDADRDATLFITQQMLLKRDLDWAATFFTTSVWGTDITGVSGSPSTNEVKQWDASGSDPIANIWTYSIAIKKATGFYPNTLVLGPEVFAVLANHSVILDRIKYTEKGIVTTDLLASLFNVQRVLIASAVKNTAVEGATAAMSFVFGKSALLCYANPSPSLQTPSAGYTFSWSGLFGAGGMGTRIKRFRIEERSSDRIEAEMAYDMKVVSSDVAVFFATLVS